MDALWVGLGSTVLVLTLLDVFLTVLNYDEAGFMAGRLASWQWRVVRRVTRRLPRRWRPLVLREVTGLQVMITIVAWVSITILGYALIYYGSMQGNNFKYTGGSADFASAMYFSAGQLATVGGTALLTPNTVVLEALSIVESLTGVVLVSLTLTFLLGVYDVVSSLRSLSSQFYNSGRGVRDPLSTLTPYFPDGQERGLDSHLDAISDSFSAYAAGLRFHHAAYYFQSGRDTFSLPYSLHMLSGVIQALRWGLSASNPVTQEPTLLPLIDQYERFEDHMHGLIHWESTAVPETVDIATFSRQVTEVRRNREVGPPPWSPDVPDAWVRAFVNLNVKMADLTRTTPFDDLTEAYSRYVEWLPFAYRAQQFNTAVAHDLDYQPLYSEAQNDVPELPASRVARTTPARVVLRLKELLANRVTFIDPGLVRLVHATRVMSATVAAVAIVAIVFSIIDEPLVPGAIFAGFIAMLSAPAITAGSGRRLGRFSRVGGLLAVVPALLALLLDAIVRHGTFTSSTALVIVAALSVLASMYGPRMAQLGVLAFTAYYFTVLLRLDRSDLLLLTIPAVVGVVCAVLAHAVPDRGAHARLVTGGVAAFQQRIVRSIDPLIDAVSAARWDPDLQHRARDEMNQTHHMAAFLVGQLLRDPADIGLTTEQARAVCLRVHDAELALVNLVDVTELATGAGMPLETRAQLAGALAALQQHMTANPSKPAWAAADESAVDGTRGEPGQPALQTPADIARWPRGARHVLRSAQRVQQASDGLYLARAGDLHLTEAESAALLDPGDNGPPDHSTTSVRSMLQLAASPSTAPVRRRSVQAAVSTSTALFLASFVSSTHQYWAGLPAYQVIGGTDGETFTKGIRKVLGTVIGAIVGFVIAIASDRNDLVLLPVLAVCVFGATYFQQASMPIATFWRAMLFAQLYEYLGRLDVEAIGVRIVETVIGASVALVVAAVVLPTRSRSRINRQAESLIATVNETIRAGLGIWSSGRDVSAREAIDFSRDVEKMTAQLRALSDTARAASLGPGAFDPGGVQNQLSRFWELVYHTKDFVTATELAEPAEAHVTADQWEYLTKQTSQNFRALAAAFDARRSDVVEPDLALIDLGDAVESATTRRALRSLARANQMVAIIATDAISEPDESLDDATGSESRSAGS